METTHKGKNRKRCDHCKKLIAEDANYKTWKMEHEKHWKHFCTGNHKELYIRENYNLKLKV